MQAAQELIEQYMQFADRIHEGEATRATGSCDTQHCGALSIPYPGISTAYAAATVAMPVLVPVPIWPPPSEAVVNNTMDQRTCCISRH